MRLLLSSAAIIGLLATIPEPVSAQFYGPGPFALGPFYGPATGPFYGPGPWCAVTNYGTGNMYWSCQFLSFQHCPSNMIAGNRGFCNQDPSFVSDPEDRRYRRSYRY
jgi:hypothetical protein